MFDERVWAYVPFHFWSLVLFVFGCMVGSLLNVCIHRMPRGESIVSPPSHCPHCNYSIPWYLNVPLFTWLFLKGKCANCKAPISVRYFLVELLTGIIFLACWLKAGPQSAGLALMYCLFMAGLITATFIDFEHFIIPDEITIGGMAAGFLASLAVPALHDVKTITAALQQSLWGMAIGGGLIYFILRLGKWLFGKQRFDLPSDSVLTFTDTTLKLPDQEIAYEEIFYRKSDAIELEAKQVRLVLKDLTGPLPERIFENTHVSLRPNLLRIGEESFNPEEVNQLETTTDHVIIPREAMGFGDVKFMAAIGAFLGWPAVIFSLMVSALIGSLVGVTLIGLKKQEWSTRLPYGPYIAAAAAIWVFGGKELWRWWFKVQS